KSSGKSKVKSQSSGPENSLVSVEFPREAKRSSLALAVPAGPRKDKAGAEELIRTAPFVSPVRPERRRGVEGSLVRLWHRGNVASGKWPCNVTNRPSPRPSPRSCLAGRGRSLNYQSDAIRPSGRKGE